MITVAYLPERNVLCVTGIPTPFPAGSLQVRRLGDMLAVASPHQDTLICTWADGASWTDAAGVPFSDADAAYAYLSETCSRERVLAMAVPQISPATVWQISHTLGFVPNVTLVDTAGDVFEADIRHLNEATIVVTLSAPTAGVAYLS